MRLFLFILIAVAQILLRCFASVQEAHLDLSKFDHSIYHGFDHHRELFDALTSDRKSFSVKEVKAKDTPINLAHYHDIHDEVYDTRTSYTLKDHAYHVLDSAISSKADLQDISDKNLHICSNSLSAKVNIGDYILGTGNGVLQSFKKANLWFTKTQQVSQLAKNDRDLLSISRVVTGITLTDSNCISLETDTINPLLLFSSFKIETVFNKPDPTLDKKSEKKQQPEVKRRLQTGLKYGDGLGPIPCNASAWMVPDTSDYTLYYDKGNQTTTYKYMAKLNPTKGCASIARSIAAFNFNAVVSGTPPVVQKAAKALSLGKGLTCTNCWAYAGTSIYVLAEFTATLWNGVFVRMQTKVSGDAAVNAEFEVSERTWSGSVSGPLITPTIHYSSYSIAPFLTFNYKLGGLDYASSGSGSITGSATLKGLFQAGVGVLANFDEINKFKTQLTSQTKVTNPTVTTKDLTTSFNAKVSLVATENLFFELGYSIASVKLYADVIFKKNITFSLNWSGMGSAVVTAEKTSVECGPSDRVLLTESVTNTADAQPSQVYVAGDIVKLTYSYSDHTPDEAVTLHVAIVPQSGVEIPIAQRDFHTSASGAGTFELQWTITSDERFAGADTNNAYFVLRSSQDIDKSFKTAPITLQMFTGLDGGVVAPALNDVVDPKAPLRVEWAAALLNTFVSAKTGIDHIGTHQLTEHVIIELVGEVLLGDGSVSRTVRYSVEEGVLANTGYASVMVPAALRKNPAAIAQRWYVSVSSALRPHVTTWSQGTFTFRTPLNYKGYPANAPEHVSVALARTMPPTKHLAPLQRNVKSPQHNAIVEPHTGILKAADASTVAALLRSNTSPATSNGRRLQSNAFMFSFEDYVGIQVTSIQAKVAFTIGFPVMTAPSFYPVASYSGSVPINIPPLATTAAGSTAGLPISTSFDFDPTLPIVIQGDIPLYASATNIAGPPVPPVPAPTGPAQQGWFSISVYNEPTCSPDGLVYVTALSVGRCLSLTQEFQTPNNLNYQIAQYAYNSATQTSTMVMFDYADAACTKYKGTFDATDVGVLDTCLPMEDGVHYMAFTWDAMTTGAPTFATTGPAAVSYDSQADCGNFDKITSVTIFEQEICDVLFSSSSEMESLYQTCDSSSSSTSTYYFNDASCGISSTAQTNDFLVCQEASDSAVFIDGPSAYSFGNYVTEYCGNTVVPGPAILSPASPATVGPSSTGLSSGEIAGVVTAGVGIPLIILGYLYYRSVQDKAATMAAANHVLAEKTSAVVDAVPAAAGENPLHKA